MQSIAQYCRLSCYSSPRSFQLTEAAEMLDPSASQGLCCTILVNSRQAAASISVTLHMQGVEATLFATLMSILNAGSFAGNTLGSVLTGLFGVTATNFDSLAPLVALCTLSSLAPLPLLRLVPNTNPQDEYRDRPKAEDDL